MVANALPIERYINVLVVTVISWLAASLLFALELLVHRQLRFWSKVTSYTYVSREEQSKELERARLKGRRQTVLRMHEILSSN